MVYIKYYLNTIFKHCFCLTVDVSPGIKYTENHKLLSFNQSWLFLEKTFTISKAKTFWDGEEKPNTLSLMFPSMVHWRYSPLLHNGKLKEIFQKCVTATIGRFPPYFCYSVSSNQRPSLSLLLALESGTNIEGIYLQRGLKTAIKNRTGLSSFSCSM